MAGLKDGRVAVLGASGGVGRRIVTRLLDRGYGVSAQTRDAARLGDVADRADVHAFDPRDKAAMRDFVSGSRAVIFALGMSRPGRTTLFSETTEALLPAMEKAGVRRLIAITGVGAGETKGHGGILYDWIVYPLVTKRMYVDKEVQEALIAASPFDWTLVRPASFRDSAPVGPLDVLTDMPPEKNLTAITRDEVADFVVETLASGAHVHERPFVGH